MRAHAPATTCFVSFLLMAMATAVPAGEPPSAPDEFRRVVFEQKIELQSEAPGVAASGHWAASSDQSSLLLFDVRTGLVVLKQELALPEAKGADEAEVLGIHDGKVVVSLMHDPDRQKPGGNAARMSLGPPRGYFEIVTVKLPEDGAKPEQVPVERLFKLPAKALIAPGLLEGRLVYTVDQDLHIRPVDGAAEEILALGDRPFFRPKIRGRSAFGTCVSTAYVFRLGEKGLIRTSCAGTALAPLLGRDTKLELHDDSFLVCSREGLVACDLAGKERWSLSIPHCSVDQNDDPEVICVQSLWVLLGVDPKNGAIRWRTYSDCVSGDTPAFVIGGKLVAYGERMLAVFDARTGVRLFCMFQPRELVRRVSYGSTIFLRPALTGKVLVMGYETWVDGIDLTPVSEVLANPQMRDRGNARPDSDDWYRSNAKDLARWRTYAKGQAEQLIFLLAAHPDQKTRQALLGQLVDDSKNYRLEQRDIAARFLRLDASNALSSEDRKLLYDTGPAEVLAEFTKRLGDADPARLAATLEVMRLAPERVLVALEGTLKNLPEPEARGRGEELVRQAKARLERMAVVPRGLSP
jgi:hypothetical protein